jgi:DNA-binding Lrp family transcriptional regulator
VNSYKTRQARRESVRQLALEEPGLSAREMARRLALSKDTVRRDLEQLQQDKQLTLDTSLVAEAHRLNRERGYGARRIARELGITRYAATLLLERPPAGGTGEDQRAQLARAIASVVPGEPGHTVTVSVVHHRSGPNGGWADSWTGTVESLADRILDQVSLTDAQADQIVAAVRAALKGVR